MRWMQALTISVVTRRARVLTAPTLMGAMMYEQPMIMQVFKLYCFPKMHYADTVTNITDIPQ